MSPTRQQPTQDPSALFAQALSFYRAADYERAISIFRDLVDSGYRSAPLFFYYGTAEFRLGNAGQGAELLRVSIDITPSAVALNNLGLALQDLGETHQALAAFERAIRVDRAYAAAHYNHGALLLALGRPNDALKSYDEAIRLQADYVAAHNNRGLALKMLDRVEEAIASFERAVQLRPNYAEAHNNLAVALCEQRRFGEALHSSERALSSREGFAEAHNNRGVALAGLERPEDALASYGQALQLRPAYADAYTNRGNALQDLGRFAEALADHDRAIRLKPDFAEAYTNRGNALQDLGRFGEALADHDRAIELKPELVQAHTNRGNALSNLGRFTEGLSSFDRAIELGPEHAEAYWSKAICKLLIGDLAEGWRLHEWRWKNSSLRMAPRNFSQPLWLGNEAIAGKTLLLYAEHGLGDAIQFCRYVPMAEKLGAKVILEVPSSLVSLTRTLRCGCAVVETGGELPPFDAQCPLMSLPLAFGTTLETVPADVPYLYADEEKSAYWRQRLMHSNKLKVGLVWSTGHDERRKSVAEQKRRDIPLSALECLNIDGVDFYSLQIGAAAVSELRTLESSNWGGPKIADYTGGISDFADTAALVVNLDLIITVCTSVAHLAGALGKETWVLLQRRADWRWLLDRTDSPWYPTVTLFRQPSFNDWASVVAVVRQRLVELVGSRRDLSSPAASLAPVPGK